jgi:hypothetical protein
MPTLTVLDVLLGAAELLNAEDRYTASAGCSRARDVHGAMCGFGADRAHAFTLHGACDRALRDLGGTTQAERRIARTAIHAIQAHLPHTTVVTSGAHLWWYETAWSLVTYADVVAAIDAAILGEPPPAMPERDRDEPGDPLIDDLGYLSVRSGCILRDHGIVTLAELLVYNRAELAALPGIGRGSLANIEVALARHGLSFEPVAKGAGR